MRNQKAINRASKVYRPIELPSKKKCPHCGENMTWMEGLLSDQGGFDVTVGRYCCKPCRITAKSQPSRDIQVGIIAAKAKKRPFRWEDITHLSVAEQIGILRHQQRDLHRK
jgi:hypothetical protein